MKEKPKIQSSISLKMVQRKVASIRIGIQDNRDSLKTEKKQANNTKTPLQNNNHDSNKSKGVDSKAIQMKKSRSIRRSDTEVGLGKPLPFFTPSPKKPSQCSPNYMKSTSSFEARKENTTKVIGNSSKSSTSKVVKILAKSSSSLKKGRNFKKIPSLKLKQNAKTCSSTQKDAKFPPYLELKPGATEAKGRSVHRVCAYSHCSLNDDHHSSARIPLKKFMSSRRRILKTEMGNKPEVMGKKFVDIYVPGRGDDQQVSERLSDGPLSEIDLQDDQDRSEDRSLNFSLKDEDYIIPPSVQSDVEVQSSFSVSLDEENSELEWEEGQILTADDIYDSSEIYIQNDHGNDYHKPGFETSNSIDGYPDEYPPYFHDEIVEYLCYSDAASLPDSDSTSTQTGEKDIEGLVMVKEKVAMDSGPCDEVVKENSTMEDDKQSEVLSELIEEITEAHDEDNDSCSDKTESNESDDNDVIGEIRQENSADILPKNENFQTSCEEEGVCLANIDDQDGSDQSEENDSSEVKHESEKNKAEEVETTPGMGKSNNGESDSNQELLDSCKKWMRSRKEVEDDEEDKDFNPRGPNFLEPEPDPEAEKVDLRHQEMDERRNAEEWMLDHALQKTVNQLTPARKKKVALLVEAFETVVPV